LRELLEFMFRVAPGGWRITMVTRGVGPSDTDHLFGRPFGRRETGIAVPARSSGAMNPSLRDLLSQFQEIGREAQQLAQGISDRQFNWRPRSGCWSIAECLGHLNIVGSETLEVVDAAIAEARGRGWYTNEVLRVRLVGRGLLRATEPPVRRRRRARDRHVPPADQAVNVALPALVDLIDQLTTRVQAANGLDLSKPRVSAPVASLFRISPFELLLLFAAHGRRHLEQARKVKSEAGLPKSAAAPEPGRPASSARPPR